MAGAGAGPCTADPAAAIIGWHNESGATGSGSGTQLAAMALSAVVKFASGQARAPVNDFDKLTFANPGVSGLVYGGSLGGGNADCAPDFWADRSGGAVPTTVNPSHNGSFSHTGNLTLHTATAGIGRGRQVTIYVEGNVWIQNDINFQTTNYNSLADIPSFRLIVRGGNIYVGPNVRTLNGLFVAIPTTASNGRFYTCAPSSFTPPTLGQLNNACRNNQLTVYGAVIADLIKFTRTNGSLRFSTTGENWMGGGQPAERFIYTPETWLTSDFSGQGEFDSMTTLPPIL